MTEQQYKTIVNPLLELLNKICYTTLYKFTEDQISYEYGLIEYKSFGSDYDEYETTISCSLDFIKDFYRFKLRYETPEQVNEIKCESKSFADFMESLRDQYDNNKPIKVYF